VGRASARPAGLKPGLHDVAATLRHKPLQRIVVGGEDGTIQVIAAARVDYVEADDDAILIATGGTKIRKQQSIGDLAGELDPDRFVRIHRSYLLNIERVDKIELYAKDSRCDSARRNAFAGQP